MGRKKGGLWNAKDDVLLKKLIVSRRSIRFIGKQLNKEKQEVEFRLKDLGLFDENNWSIEDSCFLKNMIYKDSIINISKFFLKDVGVICLRIIREGMSFTNIDAKRCQWSENEEIYLIENIGKLCLYDICIFLNRSLFGVCSKIIELDMGAINREISNSKQIKWTKEEKDFLSKYIDKYSLCELSAMLNKSIYTICAKAVYILPRRYSGRKNWTVEDDIFLKNNIKDKTLVYICDYLKRNVSSVRDRISVLKLNCSSENYHVDIDKDNINIIDLDYFLKIFKITRGKANHLILKRNMPCIRKKIGARKSKVFIKRDDFWVWASANKFLLNFNKLKEGDFGLEPLWVNEIRNITKDNKEWFYEDDEVLYDKVQTMTYYKIAKILNKSESDVTRRVKTLGISPFYNKYHLTVNDLADAFGLTYPVCKKWVTKYNLPCKKIKLIKRTIKCVIDIKDFWKWSEKYQDIIPFEKLEKNYLGEEPSWLKSMRKTGIYNTKNYYKKWSYRDLDTLKTLKRMGYGYDFIALTLKRTEGAVKRKDFIIKQEAL